MNGSTGIGGRFSYPIARFHDVEYGVVWIDFLYRFA